MKLLMIALGIFFISFTSHACTDFSGKFYDGDGSDENNTFKMYQAGCEYIEFDGWETKFAFDGKERLFLTIGDIKVYISNRLEDDKWIQKTTSVTTLEDGTLAYEWIKSEKTLNSDLDILSINQHDNGNITMSITKRVKD